MKKVLLSIFACSTLVVFGQDTTQLAAMNKKADLAEGWTKGGLTNINFSQVALTNWVGGGVNSISLNGLLNLYANLRRGDQTWENTLTLGYGVTKQGTTDFFKNDDRIDFTSKWGKKAFGDWYYSALLNFRSQMFDGFANPGDVTPISRLLAPAYVLGAIGLDYHPNDNFSLFIAPLTAKFTIVNDDVLSAAGAFGVDAGEKLRTEFGGYLRASYQKKEILKNVDFTTRLDLFSNYLDQPDHIDVNWETILGMRVNKYITVMVSGLLIYDHDIDVPAADAPNGAGPRTQFKQVFGAGFAYAF